MSLPPDLLLGLAGYCFVTSITPGPNNTMVLAAGGKFGLWATAPHLLGINLGFAALILAIALGLGRIFSCYPTLHAVLRYGGAAYLLFLAWRILRSGAPTAGGAAAPLSFAQAAVFQCVNPKAWLMAVGAVATYLPAAASSADLGLVTVVFAAVNAICITLWAGLGAVLHRFLIGPASLRWFNVGMALLLLLSLYLSWPQAARADDGGPTVVRDEAWFTGSLNSTAASTLPQGHFLVESYLAEVITRPDGGRESRTAQSLNLLLYGLSDDVMIGLIPRFSWRDRAEAGDLTARLQYRFTRYDEAAGMPALALVLNETLPTGKYDDLDGSGGDGSGRGAYATQLDFLADDYFIVAGRTLRLRLNFLYGASTSVDVANASVYGTSVGFRGRASPGATDDAVLALEYSFDPTWAIALDLSWERDGKTRIAGADVRTVAPATQSASLAPAVEYNLTAYTGLIAGVQVPVWRESPSRAIVPMVALNCVF